MKEYWDALSRLQKGTPIRVPKNSLINKDTVALEAGRKRGSIKKSRDSFSEIIAAIENIPAKQETGDLHHKRLLEREREKKLSYRNKYHEALNRELMLVERLAILEKELVKFRNIVAINKQG